MKRPGGVVSFADSVAKILESGDHAILQRRSASLRESLADSQQCVVWKAWTLAAPIDKVWANTHLRALRVRGLRRFSL